MKIIIIFFLLLLSMVGEAQNLDDGLVGHWPLNGNAIDESGNNLNGDINRNSMETIDGVKDSALFFNGTGFITIGDSFDLAQGNLTINAWVKIDSANKDELCIVSKASGARNSYRYAVGIDENRARVFLNFGSNTVDFIGNIEILDNEWHNISYVFERNSVIKIYMDGQFDSSMDISNAYGLDISNNHNFIIGAYAETNRYFLGALDEIRVYNRALNEQEVELLAGNVGSILTCKNLYCDREKVGIGTENTYSSNLAVKGDILSSEVRISTQEDWPDYVFESGYKFRALKDLEKFITEEKHLPGIPKAQDVKEFGYDFSEMDKLLMQKVEELTMLLVSQNSRLEGIKGNL